MTTEIQLSPARCDPVLNIIQCAGASIREVELVMRMYDWQDEEEPQDIGVETFSTDTLERYPALEAE